MALAHGGPILGLVLVGILAPYFAIGLLVGIPDTLSPDTYLTVLAVQFIAAIVICGFIRVLKDWFAKGPQQ